MSVTLEAVEALLGKGRRTIAFPAALERLFEEDTQARRCSRLKIGILVSAVLYNFFLIADWLLVPDVLRIATVLHLCIVTPWMLFAAWMMTKRPRPFVRECLAASVPLLIVLQIDYGFASTASENAAHYQYVIIPTLLYANVSLHRLAFAFAHVVTAAAAASEGAVRYGGEEFLVVLPGLQLVDAMRIAERIRRSVEKATIPNEGPGLSGIVTASFGVASASVGELTAAELIAVADTALYAAKRKGRNQVWPPLASPASNIEQISFRDRA